MYLDRLISPTNRNVHDRASGDLSGLAIFILVTVLITFVTGAGLVVGYLNT